VAPAQIHIQRAKCLFRIDTHAKNNNTELLLKRQLMKLFEMIQQIESRAELHKLSEPPNTHLDTKSLFYSTAAPTSSHLHEFIFIACFVSNAFKLLSN
jgi:hypothetical protein